MPQPKQSGFSLIELVISVGILTVIMGMTFQLMVRSQVNFDANLMLTETHANTDFAVNRVTELIRGAGANPSSAPLISALAYLEISDQGKTVRIRSDYDGDGQTNRRVSDATGTPGYYVVGSEDVILKFYPTAGDHNGIAVPELSLVMIDKTPDLPGTNPPVYDVPVVIAANIRDFVCVAGPVPVRWVDVTISGGPSRSIPADDPRYPAMPPRTVRVRLRSF